MPLVVLIGASGSGKTTIGRAIEQRHSGEVDVFYFDRIGVPSEDQMIAECGTGEAWQRTKTIEWMVRLAPLVRSGRTVLFDGQTRLSFLRDGAEAAGRPPYTPILVDCDDDTRTRRLVLERKQPQLANGKMMNWARYLRRDAERCGCAVLDTSTLSIEHCVAQVLDRLSEGLSADRGGFMAGRAPR